MVLVVVVFGFCVKIKGVHKNQRKDGKKKIVKLLIQYPAPFQFEYWTISVCLIRYLWAFSPFLSILVWLLFLYVTEMLHRSNPVIHSFKKKFYSLIRIQSLDVSLVSFIIPTELSMCSVVRLAPIAYSFFRRSCTFSFSSIKTELFISFAVYSI